MQLTLVISLLPLLAMSNPVDVLDDAPAPELAVRADKWCNVIRTAGCYTGAGRGYNKRRDITTSQQFGVRCKANGNWEGSGDGRTKYGH